MYFFVFFFFFLYYRLYVIFRFSFFFFFKQKTAYEIPLCDWSSDVCSSDLTSSGGSPGNSNLWHVIRATATRAYASGTGGVFRSEIGRASCRERVYSGV